MSTAARYGCGIRPALEYIWQIPGEPASIVRFELVPDDRGGSVLTLVHTLLPLSSAAGYGAGWHAYLDRLAEHLTGGVTTDWDVRFGEVRRHYPASLA